MARFSTLASSSKGNCTFVSGGGTSVLVDAGISFRQIRLQLAKHDLDHTDLSGVLITHEHTDHIRGLNVLLKNMHIPVYSAPETLEFLIDNNHVPKGANLIPVDSEFLLENIKVTPFDTPHDAVHSLGFRLEFPDSNKIGIATDLGYISQEVQDGLEGCNMVLLESNFDHGMLECSSYPYYLKRRIKGENGHLANEDCATAICSLVEKGTTRFVLGHLSEENNLPSLAYETTRCVLKQKQMIEGEDYLLHIAPARTAGNMVVF